jgi:hypothetical protein
MFCVEELEIKLLPADTAVECCPFVDVPFEVFVELDEPLVTPPVPGFVDDTVLVPVIALLFTGCVKLICVCVTDPELDEPKLFPAPGFVTVVEGGTTLTGTTTEASVGVMLQNNPSDTLRYRFLKTKRTDRSGSRSESNR